MGLDMGECGCVRRGLGTKKLESSVIFCGDAFKVAGEMRSGLQRSDVFPNTGKYSRIESVPVGFSAGTAHVYMALALRGHYKEHVREGDHLHLYVSRKTKSGRTKAALPLHPGSNKAKLHMSGMAWHRMAGVPWTRKHNLLFKLEDRQDRGMEWEGASEGRKTEEASALPRAKPVCLRSDKQEEMREEEREKGGGKGREAGIGGEHAARGLGQ
ncbi:unnamed protein product [Pleuronectes platessa]|uniref:Uncharacterized protein n=1 Tax=Pleuronectes platessa TaxID=8262 RepID=A0A9N7UAJ9_PLEPL|nr:unnamed protein product [Pleuronectes platessa]